MCACTCECCLYAQMSYSAALFTVSHISSCSSCLRSWLEQDTSCPTCRLPLNISGDGAHARDPQQRGALEGNLAPGGPAADARPHINQHNHFFHFDGKGLCWIFDVTLDRWAVYCLLSLAPPQPTCNSFTGFEVRGCVLASHSFYIYRKTLQLG